jgi:hypothetical protein
MSYDDEFTVEDEDGNKRCTCCGATIVKYRHKFNKGMAIGLYRLAQAGGVEHLKRLKLAYNQRTNFQKMQYWGLVRKLKASSDGGRTKGYWELTDKGRMFVNNEITIPYYAWSYRGKPVETEGEPCSINEFAYLPETYDEFEDYAETSVPMLDY